MEVQSLTFALGFGDSTDSMVLVTLSETKILFLFLTHSSACPKSLLVLAERIGTHDNARFWVSYAFFMSSSFAALLDQTQLEI